jgi:uncharacterized protein (DUF58 family)
VNQFFTAVKLFFWQWLENPSAFTQAYFIGLFLLALPLIVMAWRWKIYPHWPMVGLFLLPAISIFLIVILAWVGVIRATPAQVGFWFVIANSAVVVVAIFDLCTLPRRSAFSINRETPKIASLKKSQEVVLTLSNQSWRRFLVQLKDDVPETFTAEPGDFNLFVRGRSRTFLHYQLTSSERGAFKLENTYLRVRGRLGLWRRHLSYKQESVVNVYPDMKQLAEYALLARTNRLSLMGVRRTRKIGQDNEFERLRDYTLDDNYKFIDWRSTARRNKLTVKDFQTSQSQRIIFMLDCGRMMTNLYNGLSLLDYSLNALLMLSYVALKEGDSVGLLCFSDEVHTFVPPRGGHGQMNHLLHASFDRFPTLVESRYNQAFRYLSSHCKKRSMVVLLTNVVDEVNSKQVTQYLASAVGRHLPLGVLMRDRRIFAAAEQPNPTGPALYSAAAAAEMLIWRHQVLVDLEHQGAMMLDLYPEDLTAGLVNKYLEVKARHLL